MAQENYYFTQSDSPIQDLSLEDIQKVIEAYKEGTTIKDIRKEFTLKGKKIFHNELPYSLTDEKCTLCESAVYEKPKRIRQSKNYDILKLCTNCKHDYTDSCLCNICKEKRAEKEIKRQQLFDNTLKSYIDDNYSLKIERNDISVISEIKLLLIVQNFLTTNKNIDFEQSRGRYWSHESFSFYDEFEYIAMDLIKQNILIPSLDCDTRIGNFIDDSVFIKKTDIDNLSMFKWNLNIYEEGKKISPLEFLAFMQNERVYTDAEKDTVWRDIYKREIKFYTESIRQDLIKHDHDSELYDYITDVLIKDYSISKAYDIINKTIDNPKFLMSQDLLDLNRSESLFRIETLKNAKKYKNDTSINDVDRNIYINTFEVHRFAMMHILGNIENSFFYLNTKQILPNYKSNSIDA